MTAWITSIEEVARTVHAQHTSIDHGLNGEGVASLHDADCLVLCVKRKVDMELGRDGGRERERGREEGGRREGGREGGGGILTCIMWHIRNRVE